MVRTARLDDAIFETFELKVSRVEFESQSLQQKDKKRAKRKGENYGIRDY